MFYNVVQTPYPKTLSFKSVRRYIGMQIESLAIVQVNFIFDKFARKCEKSCECIAFKFKKRFLHKSLQLQIFCSVSSHES